MIFILMDKNNMEKLRTLVEELRSLDALFLVEGMKDRKSLEYIGVSSDKIIEISNYAIYEVRELTLSSSYRDIYDFLDEDKEGERIRKRIKKAGISLKQDLRRILFSEFHITHLEDLIKRIDKAGVPLYF